MEIEINELSDVRKELIDAAMAVNFVNGTQYGDKTNTEEQTISDKTCTKEEENLKVNLNEEPKKTKLIEEAHNVNVNVNKHFPRYSTLIDSDTSESENENKDSELSTQSNKNIEGGAKNKKQRVKKDNPKGASASVEETISFRSGTQRFHRENYVKVPYHKPKRHTLKEFLTRKTLVQPGAIKHSKPKMSKHLLEKYAKHLEARAKEAQDFFKSQSDDENAEKFVPQAIDKAVTTESANTESNNCVENELTILEDNSSNQNEEREGTRPSDEEKGNTSKGSEIKLTKNICEEFSEDTTSDKFDNADLWKVTEPNFTKNNLKKLLPLAELPPNPSLKGDSSLLIDLETGKFVSPKLSGVDSLLHTFLKNSGKQKFYMKEKSSVKNDIMEFTNSRMPNNLKETKDKPRFSYYKLKNNLKAIITKKRKELFLKKINSDRIEETSGEKNLDDYDDYDDEDDYDEIEKDSENEIKDDTQQKELEEDIWEHEVDNNIEKESIDGEKTDTDDESENAVKAIDVILGEPMQTQNIPTSFLRGDKENSDNEAELLELCSGNFEIAASMQHSSTYSKENTYEAQNNEENISRRIADTFDTSDEETSVENCMMKKLNKKTKLGFSEDEEDEEEDNAEISSNSDASEAEDVVETYIDYDSEENEIEVKVTKDDKSLKISEFFENEAELSESEWGSEDEDERDMDKYDMELADEEQFDRAKLQAELEQIHLRRMLDDDKRELKKIQDILFEDEENDGIGRQRQFRWKHAEQNLMLDNRDEEGGYCEDGNANEDNEQEWREMRHEREILLQKSHSKVDETKIEEIMAFTSSKRISLTKQIDLDSAKSENCTEPQFLISKPSAVRGSFLVRDNKFLKRLANMTSTMDVDESGNTVQMKSVKVNKCVFSTYEKTESEPKRKHPDSIDKCTPYNNKKRKNDDF